MIYIRCNSKNQILKRGNILIKFWEKVNQYVFYSKEIIVLDSVVPNKIKKMPSLQKNINILPSLQILKK